MKAESSKNAVRHLLEVRVEEVINRSSLENKLASGKKLTIKLGVDPSFPDLHLGHALALQKLKEFQNLGHRVVFVVGDFTAMIGDPAGRNAQRRPLTREEVEKNAKTYLGQVDKILDIKKAEIRHNSEWFSKMKLGDFIGIATHFSLRRLMDREDFKKRISQGGEVGLHEGLYQVLQAYDTVVLGADVELGGRDQKINLLAGRELQKKMGLPEQDIVIMPLLIGTDGSQKMSKSFGNFVGLQDKAEDAFGKIMSIPDKLILHYAELAALLEGAESKKVNELAKSEPYAAKLLVAERIVALYWGKEKSGQARDIFVTRFSKKGVPLEGYEERTVRAGAHRLVDLIVELGAASSKSEARRLIAGRAIEVRGPIVSDPNFIVDVTYPHVRIRIGKKKFFKIIPK